MKVLHRRSLRRGVLVAHAGWSIAHTRLFEQMIAVHRGAAVPHPVPTLTPASRHSCGSRYGPRPRPHVGQGVGDPGCRCGEPRDYCPVHSRCTQFCACHTFWPDQPPDSVILRVCGVHCRSRSLCLKAGPCLFSGSCCVLQPTAIRARRLVRFAHSGRLVTLKAKQVPATTRIIAIRL